MRIVFTLAALLALHSGVLAGGLYAGDDAPGAAADAIVPFATTPGECDTSVYHLEHARAGQLIGRVKSLIAQISAYAAEEDVAALPKSVILLPTSSDDTIIAICPKAHASLVKHAIKSCDALKQYAVKVQLFEVGDNGKTIPVGGPHLLIGREGSVQCTTPEESVSLNFKVDTPIADGNTEAPTPSDSETAEIAGEQAGASCPASGRCRLDCPPPIGEMSVESECDPSGIVHYGASLTSNAESCSQSATCPACKTGSCTADCCKDGCCHGEATASCCQGNGCKCDGTCCQAGADAAKSHETTNYEETLMESPVSPAGHRFSSGFGFGAGGPGLHFVGPLVWFNKGNESRCAACDAQCEVADSDDGHDCECGNAVPPSPAPASAPTCQLLDVAGQGSVILWQAPASICVKNGCEGCGIRVEGSPTGPKLTINNTGLIGSGTEGVYVQQMADPAGSSCTDGRPTLISGEEPAQPSHNAPCSCEEPEDAQQAPGAEPPALLTLSQHKDPSSGLPANPHWQEELLKAFRGRRLSELFEPQAGQTRGGHELGRLLAEFPKHDGAESTGHSGTHGLTIVDRPDRVQIFQFDVSLDGPLNVSEAAKTPNLNTCPSCREEFRAFLEEMFRAPTASEDIAQTSHHEGDRKASEAARDLPNFTHSKIATEVVCYPLKDLVLCDDAGRPVFDTCSIIDHLQTSVAPETWSHPSVSIQLDQQSVSLVITQTAEVHQKLADHLRYLRRLQIKQICSLIEHLSGDMDEAVDSSTQNDASIPNSDVELGTALPVGR